MKSKPLVSVFIPVYNREKYILEAVNSILKQSFTDFELIIVDDGSTDNTPNLLKSIKDKRIKLYFNEKNMGIPYTRNRGLELAEGEFIALLDSDDIAVQDRLYKQLNFFKNHPDCVILGGFVETIDCLSKPLGKIKYRYIDPDYICSSLIFNCPIHNTTVMAKSSMLKKFKYREYFKLAQDVDLLVRLYSSGYKLYNMNEILAYQREHRNRITVDNLSFNIFIRMEILKKQLEELKVSFNEKDLYKHLHLKGNYIKLDNFNIDVNYIRWAKEWLLKLIKGNNKSKIYPAKAFKNVVSVRWIKNLSHIDRRELTYKMHKHFLTSPLTFYGMFELIREYYLHYQFRLKIKDK
jgi:glycosyltransferase involved in cell wall biosynthesis